MHNCILIVEDDDNDLLLIKRGLQKARISNPLHVACDGAEALALLLDGPARYRICPLSFCST